MGEVNDAERLLAEALRAQAVRAPVPATDLPRTAEPGEGTGTAGTTEAEGAEQRTAESPSAGTDTGHTGHAGQRIEQQAGQQAAEHTTRHAEQDTLHSRKTDFLALPDPPTSETLPQGYGLLSGAGAGSLERERAALDPVAPVRNASRSRGRVVPGGPLPAYWVLLLAVLLGLAAGSVIGLITLV